MGHRSTENSAVLLKQEGFRGKILVDEPLSRHTSLKVGGPADLFLTPIDQNDLLVLCASLKNLGIPWFVIGGGFNLLVRDGGVRGAVISLRQLNRLDLGREGAVTAGAGVSNQSLVTFCRDNNLAGLEFLCSIPGTIGGALCMNAGAHGSVILGTLTRLVMLRANVIAEIPRNDLTFGYRFLSLAPDEIIIGGEFSLSPARKDEITARIALYRQYRQEHQPVTEPNAGSFFKNPAGGAAWRLIDGAGMRGVRVGGAAVANAHANYLVNLGDACAADFLELAVMIKAAVWEKYSIQLEEEVRIIGEEEHRESAR